MKQRNWVLTTLVVGLLGCGAESDGSSTIPGDPATPSPTTGGSTGAANPTTGAFPPPTTGGTNTTGGLPPSTTGGGTGSDDGGVCAEKMVSSERVIPRMLIVLDKSGSMGPNGNMGMIDRWGGSVMGVKAITKDLDT